MTISALMIKYNLIVMLMVIYLDLIFLINFILDFLLLLTVNVALKRYCKIFKIGLGALFGSISLFSLFVPLNGFLLSCLKLIMGLIMVLIAFGYKNAKYTFYNLIYLFMTSVILGGFLYYLQISFSYKKDGLVFYYEGLAINYIFLVVVAPLILYVFIKSMSVLKEVKNYYYKVYIVFNNGFSLTITGFLDTGNKLKDPITGKPIILINKKIVKGKYNIRSPMYVAFNTLNGHGLLECVKPKFLTINDVEFKDYLIGFSDNSFKLNGVDCLLNYEMLEDL